MDISNFKGVIFDLDGTLVDSHWVWSQIDIDFLGERGFAVPENYGKAVSAMDFRQAAVYTKELFSLPESIQEITKQWRDMAIWHYANDIEPVKGAPEFVRKLHSKGVKIALATASSRELYEPVLKRCGIYDCFDFFATTEQVERGKGFPDIYLFAARGLGLSCKDCAVFEDIIEGINAAKTGGFTVFARLNPHYTPDRERIICAAHKSFESFTELRTDLNT